jgi:hypothetical protein
MGIADLIQGDLESVDGATTVIVTDVSSQTATANVRAVRTGLSHREATMAGVAVMEGVDVVWSLVGEDLPADVPVNGDTVTDTAGVVWVIQSLTGVGVGSVVKWRCVCRRQV